MKQNVSTVNIPITVDVRQALGALQQLDAATIKASASITKTLSKLEEPKISGEAVARIQQAVAGIQPVGTLRPMTAMTDQELYDASSSPESLAQLSASLGAIEDLGAREAEILKLREAGLLNLRAQAALLQELAALREPELANLTATNVEPTTDQEIYDASHTPESLAALRASLATVDDLVTREAEIVKLREAGLLNLRAEAALLQELAALREPELEISDKGSFRKLSADLRAAAVDLPPLTQTTAAARALNEELRKLGSTVTLPKLSVEAQRLDADLARVGSTIERELAERLTAFLTTGKIKVADFVRDTLRQLATTTLRKTVISPVLGSVGKILGFADGGRPPLDRVSLVGERGPELFVPDRAGTILPNEAFDRGAGGRAATVYNIDARGADTAAVGRLEQMLLALHGSIEHRALAAVSDAARRNRF